MSEESEPVVRCPWCGSRDVRSSSRNGIRDGIMALLRLTPFRCRGCRSRFYRRVPRKPDIEDERNLPAEDHKAD